MIVCPHCGEQNNDSVCFCTKCKVNVFWNPEKSLVSRGEQESDGPKEEFKYCTPLLMWAVILGVVVGVFSTMHIGDAIWGSSPYSEARAMWTVDNSGNSRFGNYGGYVASLTVSFIFMFLSIPVSGVIAAFRQKARYVEMTCVCAIVCCIVFVLGYVRWKGLGHDFGFPQYYPSMEGARSGYEELVSALVRTTVMSGLTTIAIAIGMLLLGRVRSKKIDSL
jgi:hypothetical protein